MGITVDAVGEDDLVIFVGEEGRGKKHIGRGTVHREGDIVECGQARECGHVVLMSLNYKIVTEEDKHLYLALRYKRSYLLVSAERTGKKLGHLALERLCLLPVFSNLQFFDQASGGTGSVDVVLGKSGDVVLDPGKELGLPSVVRHESDTDFLLHRLGD